MKSRFLIFAGAALLSLGAFPLRAEDAPAPPASIEERLNALEQRNAILERNGAFTLRLSGVIQSDYRDYRHDHGTTADQFLLRRVRPTIEGTVNNVIAFRITPDFANGGGTTAGPTSGLLPDAYVELQYVKWARLRFGKFKSPVGLEHLQSDPLLPFVERGLPTQLVANRDTGVQVGGDFWNGSLSYQAAVLNGVADATSGENDANDGKEYVGRVFAVPFKSASSEWVNGLGIGIASSIGDQFGNTTNSGLTGGYRTDGQQTFFSYASGSFANGQRKRISPQGHWYGSHLGFIAEHVASSQEVRRVTTSTSTATLTHRAWQIAGSWVLTGERPSFNGVKPRKPFEPKNGGWGALEIAGRYSFFRADDEAFDKGFASTTASANRARSWTSGLNWYLNNNLRVSSDYAVTSFTGGAAAGQNRPTERVILSRVQLTY